MPALAAEPPVPDMVPDGAPDRRWIQRERASQTPPRARQYLSSQFHASLRNLESPDMAVARSARA